MIIRLCTTEVQKILKKTNYKHLLKNFVYTSLYLKIEVNSLVFISFSTEILPKICCVIQRNM